jgi:hypothetical protein
MPLNVGLWITVLRRIRADWAVLITSAITLLFAAILVSSAPIYAEAVNNAGLRRALNDAPVPSANVQVTGRFNLDNFAEGDALVVDELLALHGHAGGDVMRLGRSDSFALPDQDDVRDLAVFGFYERMTDHTTIVDGAWPATTEAPYEVALLQGTADALGLSVGDTLTLDYRHDETYQMNVRVAGIYRIDDPTDPYWYDSELELYGVTMGQSFDTYGPFVVTPAVFFDAATPRTSWVRWRLFPDFDAATTASAHEMRRETNRLISRIHERGLVNSRFSVQTSLHQLIRTIERSLLVTRASVTIVIVQLAVLAGYALVLTSRLIVDHRRVETSVLRARGASSRQLFFLAGMEALILAIPIVLVAPWISMLALRIFNYVGPLAAIDLTIYPAVSGSAYLAAAVAGTAGALLLTLPVLRERESATVVQSSRHRQEAESLLQRAGVDLAVLVIAVVGFLQLRRYSSPITETVRGTLGVDPLLVAAPALGLIAGAILALRIVPMLARLAERVAARQRAVLVTLSAWQIARRPLVYSRSILLLLLALGIGIFTVAHTQTWRQSQEDRASYEVGGDLRVRPDLRFNRQIRDINLSDAYQRVDGVRAAMPVYEALTQFGAGRDLGSTVLIDAADAGETVRIRDDLEPAGFHDMLDQMLAARPVLEGVELPGEPLRLAVRAELSTEVPVGTEEVGTERSVRFFIVVQDGEGYLHRLALGPVRPAEPAADLEVSLYSDTGNGAMALPIYPLRVTAIEAQTLGTVDSDNAGQVTLHDWRVSATPDGADWEPVSQSAIDGLEWGVSAHAFSQNTWAEVELDSAGDALTISYAAGSIPRVAVRSVTFRVEPPAPVLNAPIPILVSEMLRESGRYSVGDTLLIPVGSYAFDGQIVGVVEGFPGSRAHERPVAIADLPTLVALNQRPGDSPMAPAERWFAVDSTDVEAVTATLLQEPFASRAVTAREARASQLQQDPVALGTLGALALGFVSAILIAGAGLIAGAAGSARQRMGEFLLMRAIGLSPRQLTGWLLLENGMLIVLGVLGGTLLGLLLGWLILPLISLTQEARQVFPGVRVIIPWETIVMLQFAGLVMLAILSLVVAVIVRRGGLGEALRVQDD